MAGQGGDSDRRDRRHDRGSLRRDWCTGSRSHYRLADIGATAFQLDIRAALHLGLIEIVFVFLFVDLFDNVGTLVAVGQKAGLFNAAHEIPRINRILLADAIATVAGSLAGTSTVVSYIESSAGVAAGGRTGVTAIVTGLLFLGACGWRRWREQFRQRPRRRR